MILLQFMLLVIACNSYCLGQYVRRTQDPTCADKVEMNGEIYEDTKIQRDNGSNPYKSEQTGDYLFNIDGWTIAHGSNYTSKY